MTSIESGTLSGAVERSPPPDVQRLLVGLVGDATPVDIRWYFRTESRVDTGGWLGRSPLHVAIIGGQLAVVAPGPRPFARRVPLSTVSRGVYNHVTGSLAFPAQHQPAPPIPPLVLDPFTARSLLAVAAGPAPEAKGTVRRA